jgi:hypothetical protein
LITILDTFQFETGHKEKKAIAMNKKAGYRGSKERNYLNRKSFGIQE